MPPVRGHTYPATPEQQPGHGRVTVMQRAWSRAPTLRTGVTRFGMTSSAAPCRMLATARQQSRLRWSARHWTGVQARRSTSAAGRCACRRPRRRRRSASGVGRGGNRGVVGYLARGYRRPVVDLASSDPVQRSLDRRNRLGLAREPARPWRAASFNGRTCVSAPAAALPSVVRPSAGHGRLSH